MINIIRTKLITLRAVIALFFAVLRGRLRPDFVKFLMQKHRAKEGNIQISFFVTAQCPRQCQHCIMSHLMAQHRGYHMTLEELKDFIAISQQSRYKFEIVLTGGEPLAWQNFKDGVRLLKSSSVCDSLIVFTNAATIAPLDSESMKYIDKIRVSQYYENEENIKALSRLYPHKVEIVNREDFWINPVSPVPGTTPAECLNEEIFFFNRAVYACPHSASIAYGNKSKVELCQPLEVGFLKKLSHIKKMQQEQICTFCISNKKVRDKATKVDNLGVKSAD